MKNLYVFPIFGERALHHYPGHVRDAVRTCASSPSPLLSRRADHERAQEEVIRLLTAEWIEARTRADTAEEVEAVQAVKEWSDWMASPDAPPPLALLELFASRETLLYCQVERGSYPRTWTEKVPRKPEERLETAIWERAKSSRPVDVNELMGDRVSDLLHALRDRRTILERLKERIDEWGEARDWRTSLWCAPVCELLGITRETQEPGQIVALPDIPSLRSLVDRLLTLLDQPDGVFEDRIRKLLQYVQKRWEDSEYARRQAEYERQRLEEARKRPQPRGIFHHPT